MPQRCKNSRNESCVISLSERHYITCDITSGTRQGLVSRLHCVVTMGWTRNLKKQRLYPPVCKQVAAQMWRSYHFVTVGQSVVLRMSCPYSMNDSTQWCQVAAAHSAALPSENRGRQTQAPKRDAEASCDVCWHRKVNTNFRNA